MATTNSPRTSSSTMSFKDALKIGLVCGIAVLLVSVIVTRAWQDPTAFGHSFLYAAIAFVAVSLTACVLNWVMRNDDQNDQSFPVLK
ncbi:hypothetical protein DFO66_102186 [Brevibacterium sanguinis]|uniref:Uncharacterized protein n=2 Tax=Brevibacterium TaxID=1696 RepID=A0A366ILR2_9MICO|nr:MULTISPECIES: hypothetical protein [Brevibacterium]RBP67133.1 hypothetical protein DFO66_102186 [Brevibacterium sanguinis]RBP73658.1 hypothetical protein DFO65_102186 [Brevibacterium celere]